MHMRARMQIVESCHNQDPHTLLTIGNNSINQAVKV